MLLSPYILARLQDQHLQIKELINNLSGNMLRSCPIPGNWSIRDNIAHLARYQFVFQERMETILLGKSPAFLRYVAEEDPAFLEWQRMTLDELMGSLKKERKCILEKVETLSPAELAMSAIHPAFGKLFLTDWLEFFVFHEGHHLFTIFRLKQMALAKSSAQ